MVVFTRCVSSIPGGIVGISLTRSLASGVGVTVEVPWRRQRKNESKQIVASRDGYIRLRLPTTVGSGRGRLERKKMAELRAASVLTPPFEELVL
jgi:hypothetical protein